MYPRLENSTTRIAILNIFFTQDSEFRSFFGRIQKTTNCFRDLRTFNNTAKQTKLKGGKMTEKEYDDDIEARMLEMFGEESKEYKPKENEQRSSRSRKKIKYFKDESDSDLSEGISGKKQRLKNEAKKRGKPKTSGSTEGENLKTSLSGYRGPGCNQCSAYFMKGDVMWYVAIKRGLKKSLPKLGIKGFQQCILSNLPPDQSIIMELRVALDETCFKNKKYTTRCASIATSPIGNEQDSDNDSSDVEYFRNGKKKCLKKKTKKIQKPMTLGSLTGHEMLHEYFDEPQEIIKFLLELSENNIIDHAVIQDQLRLHKRIGQAEIIDADEKLLYYTGVKKIPDQDIRNDENKSDYSDSEVEIEQNSMKLYQYGQFPDLNHNNPDPDVVVNLYEEPTLVIKKPTKPECPYDLNGISRDDVIEFFKDNDGLKEHWQKIMDQDKYKSEFKRHVVTLTTRDVGPHSAIRQNTNISFLRQKTEKDGENVDIILIRLARKIASEHPKIGQEENGTQDKYAEHVLIPEGCERYLIHKFNMTEADAKFWYKSHHALQCDFCDLIYNDYDILDKHIFEAHQDQLNEPPEPQRVVENHDESGTEEEDTIPDFD